VPDERAGPPTHFLSAERTAPLVLAEEIARAAASPLVTAILGASGSAAALLDANRQVIAFNGSYLSAAGIDDAERLLGLRPGEALGCVHVEGQEGGCGTTAACPTCGAALAMLSVLRDGQPAEQRCALSMVRGGERLDLEFRARACRLDLDGTPMILLTLQDVSLEARRAMRERTFLHDLSNLATGLHSAAEELVAEAVTPVVEELRQLAEQLVQQIRLQRLLASGDKASLARLSRKALEVSDGLAQLRAVAERQPVASGRGVDWPRVVTGLVVQADPALFHHVLVNMVLNALEAVRPGERIRVEVLPEAARVRFRVWNPGAIPAAVVPRIFQRYFSTRPGPGRGHGTWAMKLFGEDLLGGSVTFGTSAAEGTWFELALARAGPAPA
jgi:signal transduction histidine kinase